MIEEPVHIVQYDEQWPVVFASERGRLAKSLGNANHIEHIGSTAVLRLIAKPIIDMMLGVPEYPPSQGLRGRITALAYESLGEAGVNGRLYFRRRGEFSFNLHVVQLGGPHWVSNLALRDYLRADGAARERYAAAKLAAMAGGARDLLAYSEAKSSAVATLITEARKFQANKTIERTRRESAGSG